LGAYETELIVVDISFAAVFFLGFDESFENEEFSDY